MKRSYLVKNYLKAIVFVGGITVISFEITNATNRITNATIRIRDDISCDLSYHGSKNYNRITDELYYDASTGIVQLGNINGLGNRTWIPYYGGNGYPFKYNPETKCFEMTGPSAENQLSSPSLYGTKNFIMISSDLAYDSMTGVVWLNNDSYGYGISHVWTPYYAENGIPFKYNKETGMLETIECTESN